MMDRRSHKSYGKAPFGVFVLLLFEVFTVVHCAPQGNVDYYDYYEDYGEVFQQCADLKLQGYEGYECTPKSKCDEDGYIVNRVDLRKDGSVKHFQDNDRGNKELELSNYKCPKTMIRQDYEDYDNSSDDEMICCRKLEFYGNGMEYNKCISVLYLLLALLFNLTSIR